MIKSESKSLAGDVVQDIYTHIIAGDAKGIFTKITVVIDHVDVPKYSDDLIEKIINAIKVDNLISMNGSFLKRVMKVNLEDITELLYLKKYELSSVITNSVEYSRIAKYTNAPEYNDELAYVCLEEYEYVLT